MARKQKSRLDNVLFALVTCSKEPKRAELATKVMANLNSLYCLSPFDLVIFDNASTLPHHLQDVPARAKVFRSRENLGYWSALNWILNYQKEKKEFIYIIESDLIHNSLVEIEFIQRFLLNNPDIDYVRTQEFSVRGKWKFDKNLKFLPLHNSRSEVTLKNLVTNERAWFRQVEEMPSLYISNLHPKLPGLHRWDSLLVTFSKLRQQSTFSELDFFKFATENSPLIGVHVPGLFYSLSTRKNATLIPASSYPEHSRTHNSYLNSRTGFIRDYEGRFE